MNDWRERHGTVIGEVLEFLNKNSSDYILKGGTSLMMCYKLDRFSEDIDLDSVNHKKIEPIIKSFCEEKNYKYRIAKNTETVKRFYINYGNEQRPLKVEISYRKKHISEDEINKINGIRVYNIDTICMMKATAYNSRDKIRDLYDLAFICNNYFDELSSVVKNLLRNSFEYKGLEQFDYLISTQEDELIDGDKLAEDVLVMYDRLDLLVDETEREFADHAKPLACTPLDDKVDTAQKQKDQRDDNSIKTANHSKHNGYQL